jgi:hypothetical protein
MASHSVLDLTAFRGTFPVFANYITYPDAMLNTWYGLATSYIDQNDNLDGLNGPTLDLALQLLTCHLLTQITNTGNGQPTQPINSAMEGSVQVEFERPPVKSAWGYWLSSTTYGQQLWALLKIQSAGGWSVGGLPEQSAFRKAGGIF